MEELIHMTATYSNALLVAILSHVSTFSEKLNLPIETPVSTNHVQRFIPNPYRGHLTGTVLLTNGYWFSFTQTCVDSFRAPKNWFFMDESVESVETYFGETAMDTNEMISLARETALKLGCEPSLTGPNRKMQLQGPPTLKSGHHIPYCRITWGEPDANTRAGQSCIKIDLNTQEKIVVGVSLSLPKTNQVGVPTKLGVEPELESDFKKRTWLNMSTRTNPVAQPARR